MRLKQPVIWQWNDRRDDRLRAEARFAPPRQTPIEITKTPEPVQIGHYLVEIGAVFKKLRFAYLGDNERRALARGLTEAFLHLQRMAAASSNWEARQQLTRYLVALGSLGVRRHVAGQESFARTYILLDALASGKLSPWLRRFYSGLHGLTEMGPTGRTVSYSVPDELLDMEWNARNLLLHWLERQESP